METNRIVPTDKPPVFIKRAYLNFVGPIQDKAGKDKYGLKFGFSLSDNEDKPTRADGRAELIVYPHGVPWGDWKKQLFQFQFTKNDFEQKTVTGFFGDKSEIFLFVFARIEPIFSAGEYGSEVTLITSDGQKLSLKHILGDTRH